jgi:uncharacterized membrane protein YdcZ (DUF606 family)
MSLFIAALAFSDSQALDSAKMGFWWSLLAGVVGAFAVRAGTRS